MRPKQTPTSHQLNVKRVIAARDAENIAITGRGVIDGHGLFCPNRGWRHRIFSIDDSTGITIAGITAWSA